MRSWCKCGSRKAAEMHAHGMERLMGKKQPEQPAPKPKRSQFTEAWLNDEIGGRK